MSPLPTPHLITGGCFAGEFNSLPVITAIYRPKIRMIPEHVTARPLGDVGLSMSVGFTGRP